MTFQKTILFSALPQRLFSVVAGLALLIVAATMAGAEPREGESPSATPGFNHAIPESILTADVEETSIGTLEFFDAFGRRFI